TGARPPSPASSRRRQETRPRSTRRSAALRAGRRARTAHGAEEVVAVRVQQHHVALAAEAGPIGLEAAVELRELRVSTEGFGIQRRGLRVTLALDLLRVAVGLGNDHLTLLVGVGEDLLALGEAGGAKLVGHALALGFHAAIDRLGDVGGEVDPLDPHVDDLDAEALRILAQALDDALHHLPALARQ